MRPPSEAVIVGLAIGYVCDRVGGIRVTFSYTAFSYVLLPMVIFGSGLGILEDGAQRRRKIPPCAVVVQQCA